MANEPKPNPPPSSYNPNRMRVEGSNQRISNDLYYFLLTSGWPTLLLIVLALFTVVNALFALAYLQVGGVKGAHPGSFQDAFFFSVQTLATIGYGAMYPESRGANLLVSLEVLCGILFTAMITGLSFAKFSRARARILFSRNAVVSLRDGEPHLMVRVANERRNNVVEANVRMGILRTEMTREGERLRRIVDLPLVRSQTPAFPMSWTILHRIDANSPFFGSSAEKLREEDIQLVISIVGHDETFAQTIHARHAYNWSEIVWNRRFADIFRIDERDGRPTIDYGKFHDTIAMAPEHTMRSETPTGSEAS